jgi:hypothetical protein
VRVITQKKRAAFQRRAAFVETFSVSLFDLRFLEHDMLADDRVVFPHLHLLGQISRVLLGNVEESGVRRADETNLNGRRFRHDFRVLSKSRTPRVRRGGKIAATPPKSRGFGLKTGRPDEYRV